MTPSCSTSFPSVFPDPRSHRLAGHEKGGQASAPESLRLLLLPIRPGTKFLLSAGFWIVQLLARWVCRKGFVLYKENFGLHPQLLGADL